MTAETDGSYNNYTVLQYCKIVTGGDNKIAPISGQEGGQHMTQEGPDSQSDEPAEEENKSKYRL